jgi:hypothetical protein
MMLKDSFEKGPSLKTIVLSAFFFKCEKKRAQKGRRLQCQFLAPPESVLFCAPNRQSSR